MSAQPAQRREIAGYRHFSDGTHLAVPPSVSEYGQAMADRDVTAGVAESAARVALGPATFPLPV
jgi:hypothetical protein